ncbi:MAG: PIN domain-containing protein [Actinomycetota bacterium]|nr:PIN domain-containing protein [Actinomycetota bacterium]
MTLVLDAGALIAIERGDRATVAVIEAARLDGRTVVVPAGVVAQTWRDGSRQALLARLLNATDVAVEALTDELARATGLLCAATQTSDIVDASIVIAARRHNATIVSSDRGDLTRLDQTLPIVDC